MPAKYAVRYLPAAQRDLLSIHDWIATDSLSRAIDFVEKLDKGIGKLGTHPYLGRVPRHAKLREFGYRVLAIEAHLVFYLVRGRGVEIHRVVHGSRHLEQIV